MIRCDIGPDSAVPSQPSSEEVFNRVVTGAVRLALESMADDAMVRARMLRDVARVAVAHVATGRTVADPGRHYGTQTVSASTHSCAVPLTIR
jgi:hypothetical protein